jgi:hypothetical protein
VPALSSLTSCPSSYRGNLGSRHRADWLSNSKESGTPEKVLNICTTLGRETRSYRQSTKNSARGGRVKLQVLVSLKSCFCNRYLIYNLQSHNNSQMLMPLQHVVALGQTAQSVAHPTSQNATHERYTAGTCKFRYLDCWAVLEF